ncbi:PDZ and LIM domain protein Zasp-like [Pecten maximus]|uniref:PDZ and LIM domain protein Zasp-like n=1 Tax=Pecten maximus TaxID=6579 RepID=UPI0014588AC1|nr:PDZ and LIM domain protein Zasp-like [Pecten maximus]
MADGTIEIQLRRFDTSQPWGFKMQGGVDTGCPIHVAQVNPKSVSGQAGLQNGDLIVCIGNMDVTGSTHQKARDEMIRSGNEVDLQVRRGGVAVKSAPPPEPEPEDGGSYRDVQPKTYQILEKELPQAAATGARPASIFDRKKQQRSEYTKTDKSGYMKAYGQQ